MRRSWEGERANVHRKEGKYLKSTEGVHWSGTIAEQIRGRPRRRTLRSRPGRALGEPGQGRKPDAGGCQSQRQPSRSARAHRPGDRQARIGAAAQGRTPDHRCDQPVPGIRLPEHFGPGERRPGTYTIQLTVSDAPASEGTDIRAVKDGYVSVMPLDADRDLDGATEGWLRRIL
jgi:hypothetical protein